ncbi:hypothetical protein EWM64_g10637 [Hericium alpestre]|uniref:Uncharacterized protein n=1 Tax=Hericium alpestre TaxID=135208 RepID=A0A4Y9ZF44_9AGAM|nr:hypothetical protein EWM64_g10637 [Hericium alpestre]
MIESYLQGQRAVLRGLMAYAREKEVEAKEMARRAGVNLVFEDDIEEEEEE